jgi:hypothetical protein
MKDQQSYFLTSLNILPDQLLQIETQQLLLIITQGPYLRNEEQIIEWVLALLEINQILIRSVRHFYSNLAIK